MFKKTRICNGLMLAFGGSIVIGALPMGAQAQRVEITGSSIKRVETEGALQVQTLTRADIERTGVQSTEQLLRTVSAMASSGQTQSSTGTGLATYGASTISLRGLGQERTLVLVNGQRMAAFSDGTTGATNVNNIPLAAIERVEILKDGASAVYGSDALAGVVNFILRKNFQGYEIGGTYGTPTESGGGQQYQANIIAGWGDRPADGWNLTVSGQWSKNQELMGRDRAYSKTDTVLPYYRGGGTPLGSIQGAWLPGGGELNGPVNLPGLPFSFTGTGYGNPLAPGGQCGTINMVPATNTSAEGQPYCAFDTGPFVGLLGATETAALTANFTARLTGTAELYGDAMWSRTKFNSSIQPSPLRHGPGFTATDPQFGALGIDPVLLMSPSNPNYQIASDYLTAQGLGGLVGQPLSITSRVFDYGNRTTEDESTQSRLVGGVRGEFMNQSYDVVAGWNQNKLKGTVTDGFFYQTGLAQATQNPANAWNPWSLTQTPEFQAAAAAAKYVGGTLSGTSNLYTVQGTLSGDVMTLPAGTMQYAAGYQFRRETLKTTPAAALELGDIAGLGGATLPIDANRNINAVFAELNIPIVKNLDAGLAVRFDDYNDVGNTTNWKGNVRWQPMQQLLLRGSYGTGFRAPTLSDLFTPQTPGTSSQINDPVTGQTDFQTTSLTGGNPDLKPETSTQYSLGMVLQPIRSLSVGLDFFNIQVNDTIAQPSDQEIVTNNLNGDPAYANLVVRDPTTQAITLIRQVLANSGKLVVQGYDLDMNYTENLGPGVLSLGLQGTYYTKFDQTTPGGTVFGKVGTTVNGCFNPVVSSTAGLDGYGVVLRYKQYATATWTQGDWATTLGNSYARGYHTDCDLNDNPTSQDALSLWDLQVAWSGIKGAVLTLGMRNIFDTQPPSPYVANSNQFQNGYDAAQYDPRGRFVYLTGTFRF